MRSLLPRLLSHLLGAGGHVGSVDQRLSEYFHGHFKFPLRHQLSTDQLPPLNAANTPGRDKRIAGATTYEVASALASLSAFSGSLSARPASLLPSCAHAETYEDQNPVREMAPDPHEDDGTV